jgi:hypothetical protein
MIVGFGVAGPVGVVGRSSPIGPISIPTDGIGGMFAAKALLA